MRLVPTVSTLFVLLCGAGDLQALGGAPGRSYLALGDSITFGFIANAGYAYVRPDNFIGFSNYLSDALRLDAANASCPGETTGSFLAATAADNGCRFYRSLVPLHVAYAGTQAEFAAEYLKSHPETKLVTIGLGANDVLLLEARCANDAFCIEGGLPQVLSGVTTNLKTIVEALRADGYSGTMVMMNYYVLDDTVPGVISAFEALNQAIGVAAAQEGVPVADVFTAFRKAAAAGDGHACHAGLLNSSPENQFLCDIHPSQSGHALIARTIADTLADARSGAQ
jgi:lysophospholipase L1-like esterase